MRNFNYPSRQKPVIFLAFANDRLNSARYLRNLPREQRGIGNALEKAKQAGLCEIVERPNATIDDILDIFQDKNHNDRIAIFHFGGHADCYKLLLESFTGARSFAFKEGLVSFFAHQKGLKLVFLNACSTEQHALELKQAGIPAVIGTSQEINDGVATRLAIRFYHGIANGHSLERAWREAEDDIKIRHGSSNFSAMYHYSQQEKPPDRFPWDIFFKGGAENVKEWNLPDSAHDPLFGMPPLPHNRSLPDKPFLFLSRYEREHAELFFGRSYYIRQLYDRIADEKSSPIILLYGRSGVGKSSLLEAGLLPRLEESHIVLYTRRLREKGLLGTLEETLNNKLLPIKTDIKNPTIAKKWKLIEFKTRKPLVIILDQVEEIFSQSNKRFFNEFDEFMVTLKNVFEKPMFYPKGKLILSYRKEYHPEIEEKFKIVGLGRASFFIQPLNRLDIIEVVTGLNRSQRLKDKYNLEVEDQLPGIIADDLLADNDSPVTPTLQVVLTKMWDCSKKDEFSPVREFTVDKYRVLRKQGLLMEDFFKQQMGKLKIWDTNFVVSGLALDLLKFHTTELGSARCRNIDEIQQMYRHYGDMIVDLVQYLKHLYLLADTQHNKNETILAHDILAPIVIKEYNNSDKPGQRASRILATRAEDFKNNPRDVWLSEADLNIVETGTQGMRTLDKEEQKLLEKSRERKERRQRQIKRYRTIRTSSIILISLLIFAVIATYLWKEASNQKIIKAHYLATLAQSDAAEDPTAALCSAQKARQLYESGITTRALYKIYRENMFYKIIARLEQNLKSAVFSGDGRHIIAFFYDGTVRVWNLQGKELMGVKRNKVKAACETFSSNSRYIVTGTADGIVHLRDGKGKPIQDFIGHEGRLHSYIFSPDGNYFLTGSEDQTARLWDLQGNQLEVFRGHEGSITSVAFSPGGRYILTASRDNTLQLWELRNKELKCFLGHRNRVYSVVFTPDGKHILTGSKDGSLRLWDREGNHFELFNDPDTSVISVAISPEGTYVLAGFEDGTIRLWDREGKELWAIKGHASEVSSVVFSPDGQKILTASYDKAFCLWDLKGDELMACQKHKHRIASAAFSPDGQYILTGSYDRTACLWDLEGNKLHIFRGHKNWITAVAFWPDGRSIVTGSGSKIQQWDLKGNELQVFKGHRNIVYSIVFSPDGKYVLTGSSDKTARLWDLKGNQLQIFKGHEGVIYSVAFSPDGKNVLTGSFDGTARLWKINKVEDFLKTVIGEKLDERQ